MYIIPTGHSHLTSHPPATLSTATLPTNPFSHWRSFVLFGDQLSLITAIFVTMGVAQFPEAWWDPQCVYN